MRRSPVPALSALLLAGLLLAGCSTGGDAESVVAGSGGSAAGDAAAGGVADPGAVPAPAAGDGTGGGRTDGLDSPLTVVSRRAAAGASLIRTADLSVRVDDVRRAADEAGRITAAAAGQVSAEERSGSGDESSAVVVLRVPPAAFDDVLGRLAALGEEQERRVGTQDVHEQVVDLASRVATQKASVARVRALLDQADDLGEVVQVEGELTQRTADLESLQSRLAALEEQVELSTVTLRLHADDDRIGPAAAPGFLDGLAAGWDAVLVSLRLVGVTIGAVLPFTPLLLVVGLLVHRSLARRAAGGPASPWSRQAR